MAPTILILGGLGLDRTRQLLPFLLSPQGPSPAFIRVVDKYLIIPAADAYTTYVDAAARVAIKQTGVVEYLQGNLLTEATRTKAFTLPETHGGPSKSFDIVFDFTGESDFELPEVVHIERTLRLALLLGQTAVTHSVGCYVRVLTEFYRLAGGKKGKVGEDGVGEPWGVRASWYHEAGRGLAKIPGLNLVLLRPGMMYGDYTVSGITPRVLMGEIYRFLDEKLEFLWAEGLAQNTIHSTDFCAAALAVVNWALATGPSAALALAGEDLPTTLTSDDLVKDVPGAAKKEESIKAVVFNVVDDGDTTQADVAKAVSEVVGVEAGFHGSIISGFAKLNMGTVIEDVNDKHLEGWSALLTASNPPMSTTIPISPHVAPDILQPYPISLSNKKLKEVVGWKPEFRLTTEVVRDTVAKFKAEGNWPNAPPKKSKK